MTIHNLLKNNQLIHFWKMLYLFHQFSLLKNFPVTNSNDSKHITTTNGQFKLLVGGWTNLFEKYESKWESSPSFGVNIKNIWNCHHRIRLGFFKFISCSTLQTAVLWGLKFPGKGRPVSSSPCWQEIGWGAISYIFPSSNQQRRRYETFST